MKCMLCTYACAPHASCLVLPETQKAPGFPLNWSYRWLWITVLVLGLEPSPLEEQVLVTTDPSLQPLSLVFFNVRINHSGYVTSASAVLISTIEKHT